MCHALTGDDGAPTNYPNAIRQELMSLAGSAAREALSGTTTNKRDELAKKVGPNVKKFFEGERGHSGPFFTCVEVADKAPTTIVKRAVQASHGIRVCLYLSVYASVEDSTASQLFSGFSSAQRMINRVTLVPLLKLIKGSVSESMQSYIDMAMTATGGDVGFGSILCPLTGNEALSGSENKKMLETIDQVLDQKESFKAAVSSAIENYLTAAPASKPESESESASKPESESESASKPESESESASKPESESESVSKPESESESASKPESESEPVSKPESAL